MAVYTLSVHLTDDSHCRLIAKIPHDRRLVYTSETVAQAADESTHQLLTRLVSLAEHLGRQAPGLFPRCGGFWRWPEDDGSVRYLLIEEFIPGVSVERLKHDYEQQLLAGHLSADAYHQRRTAAERLAVATFLRLWEALGRQTFTSDPSPWNVLVPPSTGALEDPRTATIIDLHSLEEPAGLVYVVQRLAAVYGMRREVIEDVLLPGIGDAMGIEAARLTLCAEVPQFEAEAERTHRHLGVDVQRPLVTAIKRLCDGRVSSVG